MDVMNNQNNILTYLKKFNILYKEKGFQIVGLFGSYARKEEDRFSDIDLTYKMNHEVFYKDNAFAKLIALDKIKSELESIFHQKVDLIPANTKNKFIQTSLKREQILL